MESGLSERMKAALEELDTKQTSCAANRKPAGQETINLSSGQNEVLRPELVEFLKTTVEDKLTENVCSQSHHSMHTEHVDVCLSISCWWRCGTARGSVVLFQRLPSSNTHSEAGAHCGHCRSDRRNRKRYTCRM